MANSFIITGIDQGLGTTTVVLSLMASVAQRGLSVAAMKPIALDCRQTESGPRSDDVLRLQNAATVKLPYDVINPYPLLGSLPVALSARDQGLSISMREIIDKFQQVSESCAVIFVEGCRGWSEPLNADKTFADLFTMIDVPVIMVVSINGSAPNQAINTYQNILKAGVCPAGWVANILSAEEPATPRIIELIQQHIYTPLVGIIPPFRQVNEKRVADFLDLDFLLGFDGCQKKH